MKTTTTTTTITTSSCTFKQWLTKKGFLVVKTEDQLSATSFSCYNNNFPRNVARDDSTSGEKKEVTEAAILTIYSYEKDAKWRNYCSDHNWFCLVPSLSTDIKVAAKW